MDQLMTQEESYAERRRLFKDIWNTSMNMVDKEDIMTKPKVIKTLRLSEVDRCVAKKKKKQKLKNLRAVCNKILDFCDRQDADDLFYEQMVTTGKKPSTCSNPTEEAKNKTKKKLKVKKRIRKSKSLFAPNDITIARATTSERKHPLPKKNSRHTSAMKSNKLTSFAPSKLNNTSVNPRILTMDNILRTSSMLRPTLIKKKRIKKKSSDLTMATGNMNNKLPTNKRVLKIKTVNVNTFFKMQYK